MTALVLGATGLVGSHVRAELERRGLKATGTSTSGKGAEHALDLTDADAVNRLIAEVRPRLIVHAAGISSLATAWEHPGFAFAVNTTGLLHLLEAMRRNAPASHLVFTSSAGVYGPPGPEGEAFTEESPLRPASPYGASKATAEILCGQYEREHEMAITIARLFNQVGPGQDASQAPSEFAREIARAEGEGDTRVALPVGNPAIERDFTDVRDTARAIADLAGSGRAGTFNVCSGTATSLARVVQLLGQATPLEVSITAKPDHHRPADVMRIIGSPAKLEAATGWVPATPLAESLALLLDDWRG